jgi:hypothetical protein
MGRDKDSLEKAVPIEKLVESWDSLFQGLLQFLLGLGLEDKGTSALSYIEGDVFIFRISECYEYIEFYEKHNISSIEHLYGDYVSVEEESTLIMLVNAIKIEILAQKRREKLSLK